MLVVIFFYGTLGSCTRQRLYGEKKSGFFYESDISVEKFDSLNTHTNRYTSDNNVYKGLQTYTYNFYYEDLDGNRYVFEEIPGSTELDYIERAKAWNFVSVNNKNENTIDHILMNVNCGLEPMVRKNPDYNQTVISYNYPQRNGKQIFNETTGLIENELNIWMHPPREKLFRILEINPFPYIKAPYQVGNKWTWSLKIGSFWGDQRWITWNGTIENKYQYEIVNIKRINSFKGKIKCYEVSATATSEIGTTRLNAFFNNTYGFVKLIYLNIDSTKLVLELVDIDKPHPSQSCL